MEQDAKRAVQLFERFVGGGDDEALKTETASLGIRSASCVPEAGTHAWYREPLKRWSPSSVESGHSPFPFHDSGLRV